MPADTLHRVAEFDTPAGINVPQTAFGLVIWMLGRWGGIAIATMFLAYAWQDSNEAHKRQTERLIFILESKAKTDTELSGALLKLSVAIQEIATEARVSHRNQ